jgi:transposase-like protein
MAADRVIRFMDHLAHSPTCLHCSQTMTFARAVAPVGLRRAQPYFLCQRCGRVETREQDNTRPE